MLISALSSLIYPAVEQRAKQLHQVKAAELAQSLLNEIQNKAFDEESDMAGGRVRCGETSAPSCSVTMGAEGGETRVNYNDVDDYHGLSYGAGQVENSQGQVLGLYLGFAMDVSVCNDENYDGSCTGNNYTAKLITVTITTPTGFALNFSTYRANF